MSDPWETVIRHVLMTMPAGVDERSKLLRSLDKLVPAGHELKDQVAQLRFGIDHHLTQLRELALGGEGRVS